MEMALSSPRYDLESCLEVAREVSANGGEVTGHTLAHLLGYKSVENGAFLSRVGAAKQFGLIDGSSTALRVTARAMAILHPDFPETAARARFEAFMAVPLFGAVFESMQGKPLPPSKTGFKNMLRTQFGVGEKQLAVAAGRLLDSAQQAGLFDIAGTGKMLKPLFSTSGSGQTPPVEASPETGPFDQLRIAGLGRGRRVSARDRRRR